MKAYKAFDKNLCCNGFQYKMGKIYKHNGPINLCEAGFHACENLYDCFGYYAFDPEATRVAEVDIQGEVKKASDDSKLVTNKIKILRELSWEEVLKLCNSGDRNFGDRNFGDRNFGNRNFGNGNFGNWNSGDGNFGNGNFGDRNFGNWNFGNRNFGNGNFGDWNSGDWNTGYFNTNQPDKVRIFNKWIARKEFEKVIFPSFLYFDLTQWVSSDVATDAEKKQHKQEIETCGGFLRTMKYKDAFKLAWDNASESDRAMVKKIPGFDAELFEEISGIKI